MPKIPVEYDLNVFINCPFDEDYKPFFDAIVFVVQIAGFKPRSALEAINSGQYRLEKIMNIISECRYSIHDISRTELDKVHSLPRFNMPLELGIDLGCKKFGTKKHQTKSLLIMDKDKHRYQRFISDISGQDITSHNEDIEQTIREVRNWLNAESKSNRMPGGLYMYRRYRIYQKELPKISKNLKQDVRELTFMDFTNIIRIWLEENET